MTSREIDAVRRMAPAERPDPSESWYEVLEEEEEADRHALHRPVMVGALAVLIGFGGLVGWAFSADLDSASVASGAVTVSSNIRQVSHLEGGVLKELHVREGDYVTAGQTLMELDGTRVRAELGQMRGERTGLVAKLARLRAEQTSAEDIDFPPMLTESVTPLAESVMTDETLLFERRRGSYEARLAAQEKAIEQHRSEADALASQIEANQRQRELLDEQLVSIRGLEEKGYATRARVIELEGIWSGLVGDGGEFRAERARAEQAMARAQVDLIGIQTEWQSNVANQIQETQLALNDVNERVTASEDTLSRLVVRSPADGTVLNVAYRTTGSAIRPGDPLMEIVPDGDAMVVEAKMNLRDIDAVRVGSPTKVRLTAYNARVLAPLDGEIVYVAADRTVDDQNDLSYYVIRAEVTPEALAAHPEVALYPGMPAELLIRNRPRKAVDYLLEPITQSFNRAFRED